MHQTFTGSSRRPRQVNLSARGAPSNPFAKLDPRAGTTPAAGAQNALAKAQADRAARQQERERTQAATQIQRTYRGHAGRRAFRDEQRRAWDAGERLDDDDDYDEDTTMSVDGDTAAAATVAAGDRRHDQHGHALAPYADETEALGQLKMLLRFARPSDRQDLARAWQWYRRLQQTLDGSSQRPDGGGLWRDPLLRLQDRCLGALERAQDDTDARNMLLHLIKHVASVAPLRTAAQARRYYSTLNSALDRGGDDGGGIDIDLLVAPLQIISSSTLVAYQGFITLLQRPDLEQALAKVGSLDQLAGRVNCKLLGSALAQLLRGELFVELHRDAARQPAVVDRWTWLLAHVVYMYRHAHGFADAERYASDDDFVFVVTTILSAMVDHVEVEPLSSLDLDQPSDAARQGQQQQQQQQQHRRRRHSSRLVPRFVGDQVSSLVNQASIGGLLAQLGADDDTDDSSTATILGRGNDDDDGGTRDKRSRTRILANYILTLFRLFPRKGDEIRMWLYLGSTSANSRQDRQHSLPVVKLFWQALRGSQIFRDISNDARAAVNLLKPVAPLLASTRASTQASSSAVAAAAAAASAQAEVDDQWRITLMFIGLYTFVLKVMDDEEFFSNGRQAVGLGRENNLRLVEVEELVTFLKHLGFTMYYNAADIISTHDEDERRNIGSLFQSHDAPAAAHARQTSSSQPDHIAGIQGMSLDYFKGLVTGLLRALYERDSRRPFLPKDHWLMTSRFDMTNFIDAVVEEEERRSKVQEEDEQDGGDDYDSADDDDDGEDHHSSGRQTAAAGLVGTGHAQRLQQIERRQRQQRKMSRRRYLQAVAPRLEILQNMPFLIPFATRVQIFRRFVHLDQLKRRAGHTDPEIWRMAQASRGLREHGASNPLERHHAKIRREHEFEDAFDQFYELGAALKEPIQITFVDQFDTPEAGIDGGGVTKEFLTSVTSQAFAPADGVQLFAENEQHLLYPNPTAVDEQRELLRESGLADADPAARAVVAGLLQRYEFLGRIIGKCLYEGILVDIRFAGFFLLKWALTGGTGAAARESGYRANLNDLRDLDEGLYQGLIQLKNYAGDVEDFSLNFTITDTLTLPAFPSPAAALSSSRVERRRREKNIQRDLKPNGSNLAVTNRDRLVYISYVARHRLSSQPFAQTAAFLRGLSALIQPSWLSMFNQQELQTLVSGGAALIDVADLRRNTVYGGLYVVGDDGREHPSVQLFWRVMHSLDDADRRRVLKFVTSTPRAPLLGFGSLHPRFSIRDSGDDETRLPSTSTCVNLLKLPRYSSADVCREKLLLAVRSGAGFDLS